MTVHQSIAAADRTGPWEADALAILREMDPGAEVTHVMMTSPWTRGVLTVKEAELISLAIAVSPTCLNEQATRRHIRGALAAGATSREVMLFIKASTIVSMHSCSLGASILAEEAKVAGVEPDRSRARPVTPACDALHDSGAWNEAWNPFFLQDPEWTEEIMASCAGIYDNGGVLSPRMLELVAIALDATCTHMYAPGVRRHVKTALALGVSIEEIMAVLELCVSQGAQALNLGLPLLAEELAAAKS